MYAAVLHPMLLSFTDARIELEYARHQAAGWQDLDKQAGSVCLFLFILYQLLKSRFPLMINLFAVLAFALHYLAAARTRPALYKRWRCLHILGVKAVYHLLAWCLLPNHIPATTSTASFLTGMVVGSGAFSILFISFGTMLPFRIQALCQLLWGAFFAYTSNGWLCKKLTASTLGSASTAAWYKHLSTLSPGDHTSGPACEWLDQSTSVSAQCHVLVAFLQLYVGVALPIFTFYLMEYASRKHFIRCNKTCLDAKYTEWLNDCADTWPLHVLHLLMGYSALASVCWELTDVGVHIYSWARPVKMIATSAFA